MLNALRGMGNRGVNAAPISNSGLPAANRLREEANRYEEQGNLEQAKACFEASIREAEDWLRCTRNETEFRKTIEQLIASYFYYGTLLLKHDRSGAEENYKKALEYGLHMDLEQPDVLALYSQIGAGYSSFLIKDESVSQGKSDQLSPIKMPVDKVQSPELGSVTLPCQVDASIQEKGKQADYLFEKALSTLSALELSNKPSLFLVYAHDPVHRQAHDNPAHGKAQASIAKYLIEKLSKIQINLYSDQTPMGQPYSGASEDLKKDGKLEDILTSQLCLLPDQLRDDVTPVDKVAVCCSEVLGSYLKWTHYEKFYQALQQAYLDDREAYRQGGKQHDCSAIREVVRKFSQEEDYKAGFHHVLTEMAFLQIRAAQLKDGHGIIPVPLTLNSYQPCLGHFIHETTVRMGDIYRLERQAQAGKEIYPNQSRHGVLFKLIERLFVGSHEAKTFLDKFWKGYSDCIARLNNESSPLGWSAFCELVDGIFGDIQKELHTDQARNLSEHIRIVKSLRPANFSSKDLRHALYQYYQRSNLSIQRISGQIASLDDCYINLAIVESQAQREKDQEELKKQAAVFERLPSAEQLAATNTNKIIPLEQLFEKQKLRNGSEGVPQRILIQGRAGIGKTTLCKKLVYEYYSHGLWQDLFDNILWVPLRQLKLASQATSLHCLEDLLCHRYFSTHGNAKAQALGKTFLEHQEKTLFILDGLDEATEMFSESHPLNQFLKDLLNQSRVLITSRPAGVDASQCNELDLELETVGFSSENIQTYIGKFVLNAKERAEIEQFINRTPLIQSLVNVPIQLDALCYSWSSLSKNKAVTIASLYEAMVSKLWLKDSKRLEKRKSEERLIAYKLKERISPEENYLSYLAFKGLEAEKIEFSWEDLSACEEELHKTGGINADTYKLKVTSFLHTADAEEPDEEKRSYHFLHLTFQEYFAAKFLVKHLQAYTDVEKTSVHTYGVQENSDFMPTRHEVKAFIATHKYNPRYEIVWWMVAGLLKDTALERFFNVLEQSPRDLIGMRHQQVMMGCLNEARIQLKNISVQRLETELMQWLLFELKQNGYDSSELGRQRTFPESLLCGGLLERPEREKLGFIQTLGNRSALSAEATLILISALTAQDVSVRRSAASALGKQSTQSGEAVSALIHALTDQDTDVRWRAASVLGEQSTQSGEAVSALINALTHQDVFVRSIAASALGNQRTLSGEAVSALIHALTDQDENVRSSVADALGKQRTLSGEAVSALIHALTDQDASVRRSAADALGNQRTLSGEAVSALIHALTDQDSSVRWRADSALGNQRTLSGEAVSALIHALTDQDTDVRWRAASVLGEQSTQSGEAVSALIHALTHQDVFVRSIAASALGNQSTQSGEAVSALIHALTDQDENVRSSVADALGKQSTLSGEAVSALIHALTDQDASVRRSAADALGNQRTLSGEAVSALIHALTDQDVFVRSSAASALDNQRTLSSEAVSALIHALTDQDEDVRRSAASALGNQRTQSGEAVSALIHALTDQDEDVRSSVADALGKQSTQSGEAVSALIHALTDQDEDVRSSVADALGKQSTLSGEAVSALIHALTDQDSSVRRRAADALGEQRTQSGEAVSALIHALTDQNASVRRSAASALGNQRTLSGEAVSALIHALTHQDEDVRSIAASALGKQSTLSGEAVSALIHALTDQDASVRWRAADALGKQSTLSGEAVSALIYALTHQDADARSIAASALGNQSTLSGEAVPALIHALTDQNASVRRSAASALGNQRTLSGEAVSALINALTDQDASVRRSAADALGEQSTLSGEAVSALINALMDQDADARRIAASALGSHSHMNQLFTLLGRLERSQVRVLYTQILFPRSREKIAPLYIQDNQLHFYTATGPGQPIHLSAKQSQKITKAFVDVQVEAGITSMLDKSAKEVVEIEK